MNDAMVCILSALKSGPKTTLELQAACPTTHAAKPVFDLRQAGYVITRRSLKNRVAEYKLVGRLPDAPVGAGNPVRVTSSRPETAPASSRVPRVPVFGDVDSGRPRL